MSDIEEIRNALGVLERADITDFMIGYLHQETHLSKRTIAEVISKEKEFFKKLKWL
jgi:hypothetical protein